MKKFPLIFLVAIISSCNMIRETNTDEEKTIDPLIDSFYKAKQDPDPVMNDSDSIYGGWEVVEISGRDLLQEQHSGGLPSLIVYRENSGIHGRTPLNNYTGTYRMKGDSLEFDDISLTTKRPWSDDRLDFDFMKALESVCTFQLDRGRLMLSNKEEVVLHCIRISR